MCDHHGTGGVGSGRRGRVAKMMTASPQEVWEESQGGRRNDDSVKVNQKGLDMNRPKVKAHWGMWNAF